MANRKHELRRSEISIQEILRNIDSGTPIGCRQISRLFNFVGYKTKTGKSWTSQNMDKFIDSTLDKLRAIYKEEKEKCAKNIASSRTQKATAGK